VVMQARPLVGASGDISKSTKAAFKRVDLDGNELIDRNEMQLALKRLGMSASDERADGLFATVQTDAKGVIDYSQFEELLLTASFDPETFSEADFKTAFDAVDADGNGVIDRTELAASLDRLEASMDQAGDPPPKSLCGRCMTELFDAYDENKNGVLDYKEYKMLLVMSGLPVLLSELLMAQQVKRRFSALKF